MNGKKMLTIEEDGPVTQRLSVDFVCRHERARYCIVPLSSPDSLFVYNLIDVTTAWVAES